MTAICLYDDVNGGHVRIEFHQEWLHFSLLLSSITPPPHALLVLSVYISPRSRLPPSAFLLSPAYLRLHFFFLPPSFVCNFSVFASENYFPFAHTFTPLPLSPYKCRLITCTVGICPDSMCYSWQRLPSLLTIRMRTRGSADIDPLVTSIQSSVTSMNIIDIKCR